MDSVEDRDCDQEITVASREEAADLLPGTLDMLILRVLASEPMHGYGIAQRLKLISKDVLQIGESSLYPALQRLLLNGSLDAEWRPSENNRRARYYTLTRLGRKHLAAEQQEFDRLIAAIQRVLETA
jgi:PadR family transcriptional regulator, regulatory protein PadR